MAKGFAKGIQEVGELFLPELTMSADACAEDASDGVRKIDALLGK